jgi:hypothetical protein
MVVLTRVAAGVATLGGTSGMATLGGVTGGVRVGTLGGVAGAMGSGNRGEREGVGAAWKMAANCWMAVSWALPGLGKGCCRGRILQGCDKVKCSGGGCIR